MLLPGTLWPATTGRTGIDCYLSIPGDAPVPALPGNRQVSLLPDSAQNKATGFAGCNRFFSSCKRIGHSLALGPQAATRMACPDEESAVEVRFLDVLARMRGWRIDDNELLLQELHIC